MQTNIFRIPPDQLPRLQEKLRQSGLTKTADTHQDGWAGEFYFSSDPDPMQSTWINSFADFLPKRQDGKKYSNLNYFGAFIFFRTVESARECFALSFGKSHFYIRPYCDYDFGIEIAKRVANEDEVKQTSARRFQGKQNKGIRSFNRNARLNVPPGESVDFIQAEIVDPYRHRFGESGKFGTSCLINPPVGPQGIGGVLSEISDILAQPESFALPRTIALNDELEVAEFDNLLIQELLAETGTTTFAQNTYDLFGVDFVFGSSGTFELRCGHFKPMTVDRLTIKDVKEYIRSRKIPHERILHTKVVTRRDDGTSFTQPIKECLDLIVEPHRVILTGGKWLRFNQDYLEYLDESLRQIAVEPTEFEYSTISKIEDCFNRDIVKDNVGYALADKDFSLIKTRIGTQVEAWDLQRDERVYAVKFGTAQKLNYVVDQAMNLLELFHNRAGVKEIPHFSEYCLWLGYRGARPIDHLADSGSIILKQKVDAWARRCEELGIKPVLKISHRTDPKKDPVCCESSSESTRLVSTGQ